jgi:hypothetical protein
MVTNIASDVFEGSEVNSPTASKKVPLEVTSKASQTVSIDPPQEAPSDFTQKTETIQKEVSLMVDQETSTQPQPESQKVSEAVQTKEMPDPRHASFEMSHKYSKSLIEDLCF